MGRWGIVWGDASCSLSEKNSVIEDYDHYGDHYGRPGDDHEFWGNDHHPGPGGEGEHDDKNLTPPKEEYAHYYDAEAEYYED